MRGRPSVARIRGAGAPLLVASVLASGGAAGAAAQTTPPAGPAIDPATGISAPCSSPEFRQFDYWLGSWVVRNGEGAEIGRNRISRISQGCSVEEAWIPGRGPSGGSLNWFEPATGRWNQLWVGGGGGILKLEGGLEDGVMTLSGNSVSPAGATVGNRIRWIPMPDGRVEQRWESNTGADGAWQVVFRGFYEREEETSRCLVSANGTRIEVVLDGAALGSDQMEMALITFPGALNPSTGHRHGSTEVIHILEGELDHGINGTFTRLVPGMVGVVRPGEEVIHRPRGGRPVRALVAWTPGGEVERIAPAFRPCGEGS